MTLTSKHVPECWSCGNRLMVRRDKNHDAYYCAKCGMWLEPPCLDTECRYCIGRPGQPGHAR